MIKPRCMITVDVEAMPMRAGSNHVDTLKSRRRGIRYWKNNGYCG